MLTLGCSTIRVASVVLRQRDGSRLMVRYHAMIILLQNPDTLAFVGGDGGWTPNRASAREFEYGHEAAFYCADHKLSQVQMIYEFPQPGLNITVRISTADSESSENSDSIRPLTGSGSLPPENSPRKHPPGVRSPSQ